MGMKKAGLFSKSGCDWRVIPGLNPSSKEKQANPIYENETQFLREKSPQTLGITGKNIAEHFCSAMMVEEGGFAFLRKSHADCGAPPARRQEPAFESPLKDKSSNPERD